MPTLPLELRDVEYWRKRAEEARTMAEEMKDAKTRELMRGIAASYEQIAKSYETIADYEKRHGKE